MNLEKTMSVGLEATGTKTTKAKSLAVVAMLIAIGAVLRMVTPPIAGITPNFVIGMYCLSVLLIRPNIGGALGIGLVAGVVSMMFSKSPIPYLNLATEPVGAIACLLMVKALPELSLGGYAFKPAVATVVGTLASGGLYVILNMVFLSLPAPVAMTAFASAVLPTTGINALVAQVLYLPAKKALRM